MSIFKRNKPLPTTEPYKSLEELPIYNWDKCVRSGELKYLLLDPNLKCDVDLLELFMKFHQDYLDIFGANEESERYLSLLKQKIHHIEQIILGVKFHKNYLKIVDFEIEAIEKKKGDSQDLFDICAILSKFMGFQLDVKKVTVIDYYKYIKLLEKHNTNGRKDS
jgi:hypothetical protein